jgi:hypothetical protein
MSHNSGGASSVLYVVYIYAPVKRTSYNSLKTASLQLFFLGICQILSIPATFSPFPRSHIALGQDLCSDLLDKIIFYHNVQKN